MNKNTLFMLMAAVLLLLSACTSQGNGAESKAANAEKTKQSETPKQPVSLVFYNVGGNFNAEGYFEEKFGKFIKEKFPHVTPQFIPTTAGNLTKLIASDQQPDIIFGSVGLTYANVFANNLQYDLDPLVKKYKLDLKRFEPKSLEMIRQMSDGKLYGLPFDNQASVIYYNKDLFDKFGVPYPKNGITWDELYDLSVKLTRKDGGVQYYGFTMSPGHYFLRNQLSLNLVDPKTLQINLANDNVKTLLNNIPASTKYRVSTSIKRS